MCVGILDRELLDVEKRAWVNVQGLKQSRQALHKNQSLPSDSFSCITVTTKDV